MSDPTTDRVVSETTDLEPSPTTPDPLSPAHRAMLEEGSGLSSGVIAARGYRTVTTKAELGRLGFTTDQRRVPALLIPVWDISGEVATYQLRADAPRINRQGKPVKYETPTRSHMALDVPPSIRAQVRDVRIPLLITEGVKKADAAVSHGLCCVALLGVWNWRGKDDLGGKRLLADFERIPWNGRQVSIVFDSDLLEKDPVAQALLRLGRVLRDSLKANVRVVRLPSSLPAIPRVPPLPGPGEEGGAP